MIKESRYILRRILIGVGIVLVLGFIRSNKAHALETVNVSWLNDTPSHVASDSSYQEIARGTHNLVYRNRDTGYYAICFTTGDNTCEVFNPSQYFTFTNVGIADYGSSDGDYIGLWFTNNGDLPTMRTGSSFRATFQTETFEVKIYQIQHIRTYATILQPGENGQQFSGYRNYYSYKSNVPWTPYSGVSSTLIEFLPPSAPDFVSWHWTKISNNNIITGISLRPEFSTWDTTNFDYQYKIGKDSTTWLSLTENQQLFTFHNNGVMLYVRVKNKNDNSIVLGANFTTANIGTYYDSPEYNINFSGEYRTENYLNNNVSKLQSVIREYQIYVDYFPKNSITKYQYQYITSGTCNDVQTWQQVASADNGSFTYVASQNGTLCARILDSSDTVQYEDSYEVSTIGDLAFDTGTNQVKGFFDKISSKINYGGPVGSLFRIPVETLSTLYSTMNNSNSCTPYSLPPIFGTTIKLGCYNFKNIVGNSVYNIIDAIFTFILCFGIFKMALKLYHNLISMKDIS